MRTIPVVYTLRWLQLIDLMTEEVLGLPPFVARQVRRSMHSKQLACPHIGEHLMKASTSAVPPTTTVKVPGTILLSPKLQGLTRITSHVYKCK